MRTFPEQNIPITQKNKDWYAKHLDYAQDVVVTYNGITGKMDTLYNSYNGIKTATSLAWLEKTYGTGAVERIRGYMVKLQNGELE